MNLIHIIGHLGRDPEESCTPNGKKLWTLTVATRVRGKAKGEEETIWWRLTIWGDEYDNMLRHMTKGKPVYVVAEITRKFGTYVDKNGQPQVSYDATVRSLHFVPVGGNERGQQEGQQAGGGHTPQPAAAQKSAAVFQDESSYAPQPVGGKRQSGGYDHEDEEPIPF